MYTEDDLLPISALSQLYYCPRRAGLILLEQQWSENLYTAEGAVLHRRVHEGGDETRHDLRICRGVRVCSLRLGLAGTIDCLELVRLEDGENEGISLDGASGLWIPVPVEYKHGTTRDEREYEIQLCAQALCLEEMLGLYLEKGYLYYEGSRRRLSVRFTDELRRFVEDGARQLHEMLRLGVTPSARASSKCHKCSMVDLCMPGLPVTKAVRYLAEMLEETMGGSA